MTAAAGSKELPTVPSDVVPQANKLDVLRNLVGLIAVGVVETGDLARALPLAERHVRYYALAARTLGFLSGSAKLVEVTAAGHELCTTAPGSSDETATFARAIRGSQPLRALVGDYLVAATTSADALAKRIALKAALSASTALRRAECLVAWRLQLIERGWTPPGIGVLDTSQLSVRARGALAAVGVKVPNDLRGVTHAQLLALKNCGRRTLSEIERLATQHGVAIGDEKQPDLWQADEPGANVVSLPLAFLLPLSEFELSVRSARAVAALGLERVGDLACSMPEQLLAMPNVGRRSIRELERLLKSLSLTFGMSNVSWSRAYAGAEATRRARELKRLEQAVATRLYGAHVATDVRAEVEAALRAGERLRKWMPMLIDWLGFEIDEFVTLDEVGKKHGVARQRVQQVVASAMAILARRSVLVPRLRAAMRHLDRLEWVAPGRLADVLAEEGQTVGKLTATALLRAASLFGVTTRVELRRLGTDPIVASKRGLREVRRIRAEARKLASHFGCTTVAEVAAQCGDEEPAVLRALTGWSEISWLHAARAWFWDHSTDRNALRTRIAKVLRVCEAIDAARLRSAIARDSRLEGFAPPSAVLLSFCAQTGDCHVRDDQISISEGAGSRGHLSANEETIVDVFTKLGPVLTFGEARDGCHIAGMNENSTVVLLNTSPLVARVAPGVYTLVGASVLPGDVQRAASRAGHKSRVLDDHGFAPDGRSLWITYVLSEACIVNGVLSVPAAMRESVVWSTYAIADGSGAPLGSIVIAKDQVRGLSSFFRRRGGQVGDRARLCLQMDRPEGTISLSHEPFDV